MRLSIVVVSQVYIVSQLHIVDYCFCYHVIASQKMSKKSGGGGCLHNKQSLFIDKQPEDKSSWIPSYGQSASVGFRPMMLVEATVRKEEVSVEEED